MLFALLLCLSFTARLGSAVLFGNRPAKARTARPLVFDFARLFAHFREVFATC